MSAYRYDVLSERGLVVISGQPKEAWARTLIDTLVPGRYRIVRRWKRNGVGFVKTVDHVLLSEPRDA
jgi:hypothetical protein